MNVHCGDETRIKMKFLAGANQPSGATLLLHESISDWDLAVRSGSVRSGIGDHVRRGAVQSLRMEQSASMSRRIGNCRESVLFIEQLLVHHRDPHATGQRFKSQGLRPLEYRKHKKSVRKKESKTEIRFFHPIIRLLFISYLVIVTSNILFPFYLKRNLIWNCVDFLLALHIDEIYKKFIRIYYRDIIINIITSLINILISLQTIHYLVSLIRNRLHISYSNYIVAYLN